MDSQTGVRLTATVTPAAGWVRVTIAVAGDFCLDRYLEIDASKSELSIETGLPVHNVVNVRAQPDVDAARQIA